MKKYITKKMDVQHILDSASVLLLVQYSDLSSVEWRALRRKLLDFGCRAKVVQNRKTSKVLQETKYIHLGEALLRPVLDPVGARRFLRREVRLQDGQVVGGREREVACAVINHSDRRTSILLKF